MAAQSLTGPVTSRSRTDAATPGAAPEVDAVDLHIIEELVRDARIPVAELARRVGVSRANAYKRVNQLHECGVINGYTVQLDHDRLGLAVAALILFRVDQSVPSVERVRDQLSEFGEIEYFALLAGEFDGVALMRFPDVPTLRATVVDRFHSMPEIRHTKTLLVLDEAVRKPSVRPAHPVG